MDKQFYGPKMLPKVAFKVFNDRFSVLDTWMELQLRARDSNVLCKCGELLNQIYKEYW